MSLLNNYNHDGKIAELQYQVAVYEDESAYKTLFFLLFPSLQNFAFSIVKSRLLAEEIASDLLLDVWVRRQSLLKIENLKVYLFVAAKNAAVQELRQENKYINFCIDNLDVEFASEYISPEQSVELQELNETINKAVRDLPPACQMIYKLAKEDRLKYKEIAQILELSVKTIDNQLAIALKRIANALHIAPSKKNKP